MKYDQTVFSRAITLEHGTNEETCAIDAGLTLQSTDHDFYTYTTQDNAIWAQFLDYKIGRAKAIKRDFMLRNG